MIPWLKGLLYDENSWANFYRAFLFALGEVPTIFNLGDTGSGPYWLGKVLQIVALMVKAGDKNLPVEGKPNAGQV